METRGQQPRTWLDCHRRHLEYKPLAVGMNFQPLALSWTRTSAFRQFKRRQAHGFVQFRSHGMSRALIAGGICSSRGALLSDIVELDKSKYDHWKIVCPSAPWTPRQGFGFVASPDGRFVYVVGGDDGSVRSDTWLSRNFGRSFVQQSATAPWDGRVGFSCVLAGEVLIVVGGRAPTRAGIGDLMNDVWSSRDRGQSWNLVRKNAPWKPRANASLAFTNGKLVLLGGITEVSALDDVWESLDLGATWIQLSVKSTPWKPRHSCSLLSNDDSGEILIIGGIDGDGASLCDSWSSHDAGQTWFPRQPLPQSADIYSPIVSVWDQDTLHILGPGGNLESLSDQRFIARDCRIVLMLGMRMQSAIPMDVWMSSVLPFTVDTRALWNRKSVPWRKFINYNN